MTLQRLTDMRRDLGVVRDQGRRPTCLSFAASDAHRYALGHTDWLCVEWLYFHAAKRAGTGPRCGTTMPDTQAILRDPGQPIEKAWQYSAAWPDPASWHPPSPVSSLYGCESSSCAPCLHSIRAELLAGRPVVVGVFLSQTYRSPADWTRIGTEVLLAPDRHEPIDRNNGHALVIVGHGCHEGEPVILLRNSWGSRWGHEGHAWVREDCLAPRLVGAFVIEKGDGDVLQSDVSGADAGTRLA
jgi:hypothetical protein